MPAAGVCMAHRPAPLMSDPKLRGGPTSRRLLERRKRAERALTSVVAHPGSPSVRKIRRTAAETPLAVHGMVNTPGFCSPGNVRNAFEIQSHRNMVQRESRPAPHHLRQGP